MRSLSQLARAAHHARVAAAWNHPAELVRQQHRHFAAAAATASSAASSAQATATAATAMANARVQPPTLLYIRPSVAGGAAEDPSAPSSCSLKSLAHLRTLDPSTRSRLFELTFLGTSSGRPTPARNVTSLALRIGRAHRLALFDAGEGTLRQLARCNHLSLSTLSCVFITHLHGDHVWGLCPLLSLASQAKSSTQRPSPLEAGAVPRTMHVFGPRGIAAFVKANLAATHTWLGRPVLFHELLSHDVRPDSLPQEEDVVYHQSRTFAQPSMQIFENSSMKVWAAPLRHRDLSCWGYVVEEQLGVAEGETAEAVQLLRPRRLAVLGDTSDSSALVDVATNVDAMVHEATYLDSDTFERGSPFLKGHSSARMAGAFAKQCNAHHLLLTHFSKRYAGDHSVGADGERETKLHVQQASEAIGHKRVYAAQDFQIYHVAAAPVVPTSSSFAAASSSSATPAPSTAGSSRNRSAAVGFSRSAFSRSVL